MSEGKLISILVGVIALLGGGWFLHHSGYSQGDTAGSSRVQIRWDDDKAAIQKVTDASIATATKQRDDALEANQVIHDNYEKQLALSGADSAQFASRLRAAEARLTAANSRPVPTDSTGQDNVSSSSSSSADQLGQLVSLVTEFRRECKANDDTLDSIYASVNKQPHVFQ